MLEPGTRDEGASAYRNDGNALRWTAQQTNLVRAVIDETHHLDAPLPRDPVSGKRYVSPLNQPELERFYETWSADPIACIRAANEAIGLLRDPWRRQRYLEAAVDLEIEMDREIHAREWRRDLSGLPAYLPDGYTDYGLQSSGGADSRRERILVDKERLKRELLTARSTAVEAMSRSSFGGLETLLLEPATRLRTELDYEETRVRGDEEKDATLRLSDRLERGGLGRRHLAILYQLRLQEAGLRSTMTKGVVRLFSFKLRHVWHVVHEGSRLALVDVGFADGTSPLVLFGHSLDEIGEQAAQHHRSYSPCAKSRNRYQVRGLRGHETEALPSRVL
jgi:hypothetical protein